MNELGIRSVRADMLKALLIRASDARGAVLHSEAYAWRRVNSEQNKKSKQGPTPMIYSWLGARHVRRTGALE